MITGGGVGVGVGPFGGSLMISVLTERLPRATPPVGVPRVNVSVRLGPGSARSVPVMNWVVWPIPNVSGLAVTPLKAVPDPLAGWSDRRVHACLDPFILRRFVVPCRVPGPRRSGHAAAS